MSLASLGSSESGFAAVPYSQTNRSKPPILMIPPKNPLRNSKINSGTSHSSQCTAPQSPTSAQPNLGGDIVRPLSLSHHALPLAELKFPSESGDTDRFEESLRFSGYWDELDEFIEPSPFVTRSTATDAYNVDAEAHKDQEVASPVKPHSPAHLRKRRTPSFRGENGPAPPEPLISEGTKKKRNFWSQIRKGRKSVSTISTEVESVPPLSPVLSDDGQERSVTGSDSSACSMHTPTSMSLGPLISIDESNDDITINVIDSKTEPDAATEAAPVTPTTLAGDTDIQPSKDDEIILQPSQTHTSLSERARKFPLLMKDKTPKLVPLDLPHALTVNIPDGKLFEDDFLDTLAF